MVMRDREVEGGRLSFLNADQIREWRKKTIRNLNNREGRRVVHTSRVANNHSLAAPEGEVAGQPAIAIPDTPEPRSGRETVELLTQVYVEHVLLMKRYDPTAFRRKLAEMRALSPGAYAHMTDDQLEAAVVEVCRAVVAEPMVQKVYERAGRGGGFREVPV